MPPPQHSSQLERREPPALRSREKNAQLTRLPLALTPPLVARSQVGHGLRALGYFICRPNFPCSDITIRNLTVASLAPNVSRVLPMQCGKTQRLDLILALPR